MKALVAQVKDIRTLRFGDGMDKEGAIEFFECDTPEVGAVQKRLCL
jgi:hypothetical protein